MMGRILAMALLIVANDLLVSAVPVDLATAMDDLGEGRQEQTVGGVSNANLTAGEDGRYRPTADEEAEDEQDSEAEEDVQERSFSDSDKDYINSILTKTPAPTAPNPANGEDAWSGLFGGKGVDSMHNWNNIVSRGVDETPEMYKARQALALNSYKSANALGTGLTTALKGVAGLANADTWNKILHGTDSEKAQGALSLVSGVLSTASSIAMAVGPALGPVGLGIAVGMQVVSTIVSIVQSILKLVSGNKKKPPSPMKAGQMQANKLIDTIVYRVGEEVKKANEYQSITETMSELQTKPNLFAGNYALYEAAIQRLGGENPAEQIKDLDIEAKLDLLKEDNTQATIIGNMFMKATDSFVGIASAAKLFKDKLEEQGGMCKKTFATNACPGELWKLQQERVIQYKTLVVNFMKLFKNGVERVLIFMAKRRDFIKAIAGMYPALGKQNYIVSECDINFWTEYINTFETKLQLNGLIQMYAYYDKQIKVYEQHCGFDEEPTDGFDASKDGQFSAKVDGGAWPFEAHNDGRPPRRWDTNLYYKKGADGKFTGTNGKEDGPAYTGRWVYGDLTRGQQTSPKADRPDLTGLSASENMPDGMCGGWDNVETLFVGGWCQRSSGKNQWCADFETGWKTFFHVSERRKRGNMPFQTEECGPHDSDDDRCNSIHNQCVQQQDIETVCDNVGAYGETRTVDYMETGRGPWKDVAWEGNDPDLWFYNAAGIAAQKMNPDTPDLERPVEEPKDTLLRFHGGPQAKPTCARDNKWSYVKGASVRAFTTHIGDDVCGQRVIGNIELKPWSCEGKPCGPGDAGKDYRSKAVKDAFANEYGDQLDKNLIHQTFTQSTSEAFPYGTVVQCFRCRSCPYKDVNPKCPRQVKTWTEVVVGDGTFLEHQLYKKSTTSPNQLEKQDAQSENDKKNTKSDSSLTHWAKMNKGYRLCKEVGRDGDSPVDDFYATTEDEYGNEQCIDSQNHSSPNQMYNLPSTCAQYYAEYSPPPASPPALPPAYLKTCAASTCPEGWSLINDGWSRCQLSYSGTAALKYRSNNPTKSGWFWCWSTFGATDIYTSNPKETWAASLGQIGQWTVEQKIAWAEFCGITWSQCEEQEV